MGSSESRKVKRTVIHFPRICRAVQITGCPLTLLLVMNLRLSFLAAS
ncbi:hypothetical protein CWATWH0005_1823 [Crocosphaera watsonii WH 0005]|uniref:Uncharacterized protein n=1 Tax=Crocosphaera watsonii WH 0005 TaxID=423472 RepID=T2J1G1_CROWT|nr:hypothetical protein CWATWH0005_1823 [Crocosphaera watsonii WH 0005]